MTRTTNTAHEERLSEQTDWVDRILNGDELAVSKVISMIENKSPQVPDIMSRIHPHIGNARAIGFTGPPGVGKSTIIDCFIGHASKKNLKLGVLAIDSSSPFTGGALLGDRIRMLGGLDRDNIFIRSMGTRGQGGGLAAASKGAVKVLDAFGCDLVLVETVGVGQIELDIVKEVDTIVVCTMPGTGDYVQIMKAGIMEIADVFAVNKSDLPGADITCAEIKKMLDMVSEKSEWTPPVVPLCAIRGEGLEALWDAVVSHQDFVDQEGRLERRRKGQIRVELADLILENIKEEFWTRWGEAPEFFDLVERIFSREVDLYTASEIMIKRIKREDTPI